jgi:hypothetical protein
MMFLGGGLMEQHVNNTVHYMSRSHVEMAKVLEEQRHVAVHMCQVIQKIPNRPPFNTVEGICKNSIAVKENIAAYLNSLADLEEAIAENLGHVMKELDPPEAAGSDEDEE